MIIIFPPYFCISHSHSSCQLFYGNRGDNNDVKPVDDDDDEDYDDDDYDDDNDDDDDDDVEVLHE